jgi:hypothetical protein
LSRFTTKLYADEEHDIARATAGFCR